MPPLIESILDQITPNALLDIAIVSLLHSLHSGRSSTTMRTALLIIADGHRI